MTDTDARTAAAISVNDRLRSVARKMPGDAAINNQRVYARFVYERMMARLQQTSAAGKWILKGGVLMLALPQEVHRVTMDIDYTLRRGMSMSVTECLREMCAVQPDLQDGMSYSLVTDGKDAPRVIREDSINPTVRAKLVATLHCTRPAERRFVVDVTEAELEYEPVIRVWRPTLKGFDPLEVPAYPWEIVMAEKLHTIMTGSIANPRLRDYMDVIALVREGVADMDHVGGWLDKVFEARGDAGKQFEEAISFTHEFAEKRQDDWAATLGRTGYSGTMPTTMAAAIDEVREIALLLTSSRTPSRVP